MIQIFLFLKKHLKIILLIGLPVYGILISSINTALLFLLNPIAMSIQAIMAMPFFYDKSTYQYEWFTIPFFIIISNLIFWIPIALLINKRFKR